VVSAQFMAADLIYVPAVAHSEGANGSVWKTDVTITNVDSTPVDVGIFFVPSGRDDHSNFLAGRDDALGGSEDQGFGFVNDALSNIPPGGTVTLPDIVGQYWYPKFGVSASNGALVVFSWESGTLDNDGNRTYRNVVVTTRTYNSTKIKIEDPDNSGQFIEKDATFGQTLPGVPWYNLADASIKNDQRDLSYEVLAGGQENDTYRYNVGIFNTSDLQTSIAVVIQPFDATGHQLTDDSGVALQKTLLLPPLAHVQLYRILQTSFNLTNAKDILLRISFVNWTTLGTAPVPTFTCYGSLIDNRSNDPTTILPSFGYPYDIDKVWKVPSGTASATAESISRWGFPRRGGVSRRPVRMPPR
jgi:hypothetical protein